MPELQDIFRQYGESYRQKNKLPPHVLKAMRAIENCRTSALGGHIDVCNDCGHTKISYNSCRNRHCPKCQTLAKERWVDNQKGNLLNVGYFHIVLTIPDILNPIAFQNQKAVYGILFKAAAETLTELANDKKHLGATVGFTSILHTWGQNLSHHPHIHCVVPGGGLTSLGKWIKSRKKFFIPVKVLSRKFRGEFLFYLKQAYINEKLSFYGTQSNLVNKNKFHSFLSTLYSKEWVVYCKPPFKTAASVVEYLGRYTHRVAISNSRILSIDHGVICFKWRDYKDNSKSKVMQLTAEEFIRRFLIHVLPPKFMKIRHYGLLGSRNKKEKLTLCKKLTSTALCNSDKASTLDLIIRLVGRDVTKCPVCGGNHLLKTGLPNRSPPVALAS